MTIHIPSAEKCAKANAARQKAATKHRVVAWVLGHYKTTGNPVCQNDVIAALKIGRNIVNRAFRELVHEKKIHCIGLASDTRRGDLAMNMKMYGPPEVPVIPRSLDGGSAQRVSGAKARAYLGKPAALAAPRVKTPRYRGEKGRQYVPTFSPLARDPFAHMKLAMLAR